MAIRADCRLGAAIKPKQNHSVPASRRNPDETRYRMAVKAGSFLLKPAHSFAILT
jgi:hypothetical protein